MTELNYHPFQIKQRTTYQELLDKLNEEERPFPSNGDDHERVMKDVLDVLHFIDVFKDSYEVSGTIFSDTEISDVSDIYCIYLVDNSNNDCYIKFKKGKIINVMDGHDCYDCACDKIIHREGMFRTYLNGEETDNEFLMA